jgi:radical SAM superfamily enzyme YgiQ (UPF0313 family)
MKPCIVLINPAPVHNSAVQSAIRERYPYPPLGMLSVAGQAMMHGYEVVVLDFFREDLMRKQDFVARLRSVEAEPVLIGLCTYTETVFDALAIARTAHEVFPRSPLVFGGPHATFCARDLLESNPFIDFVVRAEAEATIVELLVHLRHPDSLPLADIPGLTFRTPDGDIVQTPARGFVSHLDCLPLPPYELLPTSVSDTGDVVFVFMTSRGCPGNCVFCASRALSGSRYRLHSAEHLIALVHDQREKTGFVALGVMDDTFLVNYERLRKFCLYLQQIGFRGPWTCKSRVDTINERNLGLLRASNCKSIHIGVESGDDEVLRSLDKRISLKRIADAIVLMKSHGIRPECSFMLGHHRDTHETIEKTLMLARAIRDRKIGMSVVGISTPLPGTPLYERAPEFGVRILTRDWYRYDLSTPVIETDHFSADDLKRAQYFFDVRSRTEDGGRALYEGDLSEFEAWLDAFLERIATLRRGDQAADGMAAAPDGGDARLAGVGR